MLFYYYDEKAIGNFYFILCLKALQIAVAQKNVQIESTAVRTDEKNNQLLNRAEAQSLITLVTSLGGGAAKLCLVTGT